MVAIGVTTAQMDRSGPRQFSVAQSHRLAACLLYRPEAPPRSGAERPGAIVQADAVPVTASVMVYARPDAAYVATFEQTTVGVWVGSGAVEKVPTDDISVLGAAVSQRLAASRVKVAHPRQSEWTAQRQRSLGPLIRLAGVRSWRAFLSGSVAASVRRDGTLVTVRPYRRDERRIDVFDEVVRDTQVPGCPHGRRARLRRPRCD